MGVPGDSGCGNPLGRGRAGLAPRDDPTLDNTGQLTDATLTASYEYDAFNRRIRRTLSGNQTLDEQYLYDGTGDVDVSLVLAANGNLKLRQLNAPGSNQVLAEDRISGGITTPRWALAGHEGSVRDVLNNSGAVVDHIQYDSFGKIIAETTPSERTRATYTGTPMDAETGFIYLHNRYMDPSTGRFVSQNPISFVAGDTNLYRYVENDPADSTDPNGLQAIDATASPDVMQPVEMAIAQAKQAGVPPQLMVAAVAAYLVAGDKVDEVGWAVRHDLEGFAAFEAEQVKSANEWYCNSAVGRLQGEAIQALLGLFSSDKPCPNAGNERNPAQDKKLSPGEIKRLKDRKIDPEDLKDYNAGRDLFKDKNGNIYIKPKDGSGPGDPTGININDL